MLGAALELSNIMDKIDRDRLGSNGTQAQSAKKRGRRTRTNVSVDDPTQEPPSPSPARNNFEAG